MKKVILLVFVFLFFEKNAFSQKDSVCDSIYDSVYYVNLFIVEGKKRPSHLQGFVRDRAIISKVVDLRNLSEFDDFYYTNFHFFSSQADVWNKASRCITEFDVKKLLDTDWYLLFASSFAESTDTFDLKLANDVTIYGAIVFAKGWFWKTDVSEKQTFSSHDYEINSL